MKARFGFGPVLSVQIAHLQHGLLGLMSQAFEPDESVCMVGVNCVVEAP